MAGTLIEGLRELALEHEGHRRELLLNTAATLEREANPWQPIETAPRDPEHKCSRHEALRADITSLTKTMG